jgi:hypothetical protein
MGDGRASTCEQSWDVVAPLVTAMIHAPSLVPPYSVLEQLTPLISIAPLPCRRAATAPMCRATAVAGFERWRKREGGIAKRSRRLGYPQRAYAGEGSRGTPSGSMAVGRPPTHKRDMEQRANILPWQGEGEED